MQNFYSNNNRELLKSIHKLNSVEGRVEDFMDDNVIMEYVIEKKKSNLFQASGGVKNSGCESLRCRLCGGNQFIVGQDKYFTAIKCKTCNYEVGIHKG